MNTKPLFVAKLATSLMYVTALATLAEETKQFRTWSDSTGKFTIEAAFVKFEKGKAHLERKDNGEITAVPIGKLSKADQVHVRKLLAASRKKFDSNTTATTLSKDPAASQITSGQLSWQGTWNNRKYGTNGPLICTAAPKNDKTWQARFEGKGLGKPFRYDVEIATTARGDRTLLQGTSTVDGDVYRWTGYVQGQVFYGRYRSATGNNGEFQLRQMRSKGSE